MKRLYDNDLIYGRLLPVSQPHLVARYNKALVAFGLPETKLEQFSIDRSGFSPQVAEELGDYDYLDPNGINRRFIILSPQQQTLPVVHTRFSNTDALLHEFFAANLRAINALTIRDVLYGEIEDNVSIIDDVDDLLSIEQVQFKVLSADDVIGKANRLRGLSDRLAQEEHAWNDDVLIDEMVALAQQVGDIRQNDVVPHQVVFQHEAYWTSHFGGTFVFHDEGRTTVIGNPNAPGFRKSRPWQVAYLSIDDHKRVFAFLAETGRLELPRANWMLESGFLSHRLDMVRQGLVHELEPDTKFDYMDKVWLQTFLHRHARAVSEDGVLPVLSQMERKLEQSGRIDIQEVAPEYRFHLVRGNPDHEDVWLVNRLLSVYNRHDFVMRYVFHKQLFYDDYADFEDEWRAHVVMTLKNTYLHNKAALRQRLYGL